MTLSEQLRPAVQGITDLFKGVIAAPALASGGKLPPAKPNFQSEVRPPQEQAKFFVPILKAEQQIVTGVVLQPETVDGQGDIYSADVIAEAAHNFLAKYNKQTKLGLQHKSFTQGRFSLVESWLAPMDLVINGTTVKAGAWVMSVKVLDAKIWQQVKDGRITGFSIGGKAKIQRLQPTKG